MGYLMGKRIDRKHLKKASRGQTLVEYALILAMISVVAITTLLSLGGQVKSIYSTIGSVMTSASASH